jgi:hypothetical protein
MNDLVGKTCHLLKPIRTHEGLSKFKEIATILRVTTNLDRIMYLVRFDDGITTFLFPDEVKILE